MLSIDFIVRRLFCRMLPVQGNKKEIQRIINVTVFCRVKSKLLCLMTLTHSSRHFKTSNLSEPITINKKAVKIIKQSNNLINILFQNHD